MAGGLPVRFHFENKEAALGFIEEICEKEGCRIISYGPADKKNYNELNRYFIQVEVAASDSWEGEEKREKIAEATAYFEAL